MRKTSLVLIAAASVALVAGTAQAQQSWGPNHTTYWNSDHTGKFEPGQFMQPSMQPTQPLTTQPAATQPAAQQRMYYAQPKRIKAQQRVRQQQPAKPPMNEGATPPTERGAQPPADAKPSAPPSQGDQPTQGTQPK